jgi:hypothetical protein
LQILEEESKLFFHLQQQQLIELIRAGNVEEALAFAQEYLAYKGEENESLLEELGASVLFWSVFNVSHVDLRASFHSALDPFVLITQHIVLCQGKFLHSICQW